MDSVEFWRGAVLHLSGVPEDCPLALMGRFPSLVGCFLTFMGRSPECLSLKIALENRPLGRGPLRGS